MCVAKDQDVGSLIVIYNVDCLDMYLIENLKSQVWNGGLKVEAVAYLRTYLPTCRSGCISIYNYNLRIVII